MCAKTPRISVVIPVYNQAEFVGHAIQSLLHQTINCHEIIVVDDGSTDDSRAVVSEFGDKVNYIYQENQGLAGARNTGIRAAKGDLIGLLDADDIWVPDYIEKMMALVERHPEAAVYYGCAQSIDEQGHELPQIFGKPAMHSDSLYHTLLRANFIIPSTVLMRRAIIERAGLFDQTLRSCEDWDLWLRLLPGELFVGTSVILVKYRLHRRSLSADPAGMQRAAQAVVEKHFGPDDGRWEAWSGEKRRAYGGVYRYYALLSVQRQNDWYSAGCHLSRAIQIDPTLAEDIDLFYDLAHGTQPLGHRGTAFQLNLSDNAHRILSMIKSASRELLSREFSHIFSRANGTACYALGLVADNIGDRQASRHYLISALKYRPDLWRDRRMIRHLVKAFFPPIVTEKVRRYTAARKALDDSASAGTGLP
jgi:glycosyltransferase involved in cell wall biosynthesis